MTGKWHSFKALAKALAEAYPETDTLSLTDGRLEEMLGSLEATASLPPLPEKDKPDVFFGIKVAWTQLIEDDADYNAHADDAYV